MDNIDNVKTNAAEQWLNKVRLNFDIMPSRTLQVRWAPQFANTWGTVVPADGLFTTHEAWMSWMPMDSLSFYMGRQALSYGSEMVFGANDWGQASQNFDALRMRHQGEMYWADLLWAKISDNSGLGKADHDLIGLYSVFSLESYVPMVNSLDVYALWNDGKRMGAAAAAGRKRQFMGGARLLGDMGMLFYEFEANAQMGKADKVDRKAMTADLNVGTNLMDKATVSLYGSYTTSAYDQFFPTAHKFFGDADRFGRKNITDIAVKTKWNCSDQWTTRLDGHYFLKTKTDGDIIDAAGTAFGAGATADKRPIAIEGDLVIGYHPEQDLAFEFGYALTAPVAALKEAAASADKVQHAAYLQGTFSF